MKEESVGSVAARPGTSLEACGGGTRMPGR